MLDLNLIIEELKKRVLIRVQIKPVYLIRYKGDLYGLLKAVGVPDLFFEAILVLNEINDVNAFKGDTLLLPADGVVDDILISYDRTIGNTSRLQ